MLRLSDIESEPGAETRMRLIGSLEITNHVKYILEYHITHARRRVGCTRCRQSVDRYWRARCIHLLRRDSPRFDHPWPSFLAGLSLTR